MSERMEMDNMSGQGKVEDMETEDPQSALVNPSGPAQDNITNPHTSAGEHKQQLHSQQGQQQYPMRDSFTNSGGQFAQAYQSTGVNMPIQGQHPNAKGNSFNLAQSNFPNPHPSAGEMTQALSYHMSQYISWDSGRRMDVDSVHPSTTQGSFLMQGQHPNAMRNSINPAQILIPNPSTGQIQHVDQNQSVNMPIQGQLQYVLVDPSYAAQFVQQGQHLYVLVDPSYPTQNNFTNLHPSAAQMLQQGQHPNAMGHAFNPAQSNFTNLPPSTVQFQHVPQNTSMDAEVQGQHPNAMGHAFYPAQSNFTNLPPSTVQFQHVPQNTSMDAEVQGQHPNAMGHAFYPAQSNFTNLPPSTVQFQHVPQNTSMDAEVKKDQMRRHQDASVMSFDAAQNNPTYGNTSAGQVAQATQGTSPNIGRVMVGFEQPPTSEDKDEVRAICFVQWSDGYKPQKEILTLQKYLQSFANKCNFTGDCSVLNVSEDRRAEIRIKPAAAVNNFKELVRKPIKTKDGKTVTITEISMTLPELEIQTADKASVIRPPSSVSEQQHVSCLFGEQRGSAPSSPNVPVHTDSASMTRPPSSVSEPQNVNGKHREQSDMTTTNVPKPKDNDNAQQEVNRPSSSVSEKQNVKGRHGDQSDMTTTNVLKPTNNDNAQQEDQEPTVEQSGSSSSAAASTTEEKICCVLPVVHFWYVNHIFKEDIKRIEREHGVQMSAEVNVTFVADRKDKGLTEAQSEFIDLVQKRIGDFDGSVTPLKSVDTDEFKEALKMIQRPENKLLVSLSSEEMTIYGRKPIPAAISKSLNAAQTSSANTYNSAAESKVTSLNIGMSIKDHLVDNGLNMQESHWKLMTTYFSDDIDKIKKKFSVSFKDSGIRHGQVNVKAHSKRSGGNASMESHAVRALLHLCQKIATSPNNITQHQGATGFSVSTKNSSRVDPSEGTSSGPVVNSHSEYSTRKTADSAREGASKRAGDNEDEECPICKDTFNNKKQLKCKHEFCEECLEQSKKHMGPVCPVCKDVFGVIEGTQPDGTMSVDKINSSLPGFKDCGTIVINYHFPSGKQTQRHPNPGQHYDGTSRTAYLPNNKEGKEVLLLLQKAFNQKLIFTIGKSTTTGKENQVTWNDIHHKTSMSGGPHSFGYPDPDYLRRVRDELKAKGIE